MATPPLSAQADALVQDAVVWAIQHGLVSLC
jgi:hypothetical protein